MSGDRDDGQKRRRPAQHRRARSGEDQRRARPGGNRPSDGGDYEVGFGKPPRATRFRKGQSGNPRGRPKKPKPEPIRLSDAPADVFLQDEAYRLLKFRENGQEVELPASQAVMRAAMMSALKGNRLSQRYVLEYLGRKEQQHLESHIRRFVRLERLKAQGEAQIAEHRRRGKPPPDLLPHPDDIVLNHRTAEAQVNGPETPEDLRHYEHLAELRDLCLMQAALSEKRRRRTGPKDKGKVPPAMIFAHLIEHLLPQRFRRSEAEEIALFMDYMADDWRKLEALIAREASRLEREHPPSTLSQAQRDIIERTSQHIRDQLWSETKAD